MERPEHIWQWIDDHWKTWGVYAILLGVSNFGTWILARRKDWNEWKASRQAKADKKIDARVFEALENNALWPQNRPLVVGYLVVWAHEIADHLSIDKDAIFESLERLQARGKVRKTDGNMENPAPRWHVIRR
jgi:hypothetical protein